MGSPMRFSSCDSPRGSFWNIFRFSVTGSPPLRAVVPLLFAFLLSSTCPSPTAHGSMELSLSGKLLASPEHCRTEQNFKTGLAKQTIAKLVQYKDADLRYHSSSSRQLVIKSTNQIGALCFATHTIQEYDISTTRLWSPSSVLIARLYHIMTFEANYHLMSTFSRNKSEDHISYRKNFQQHPTNDPPISWPQHPPTSLCWIDAKPHQCPPALVPSRLRPEDHVCFLEKLRMKDSCGWLQDLSKTLNWTYCILVPKSIRPELSETRTGLRSDTSISSFKERSLPPPPSSEMERIFPSSLMNSYMEEFPEPQIPLLLQAMDKLVAGPETLFANSTKFEPTFRTDSTVVLRLCSNKTHMFLHENLQDCVELKKRLISICFLCCYLDLSWIESIQEIVLVVLILCCISKS